MGTGAPGTPEEHRTPAGRHVRMLPELEERRAHLESMGTGGPEDGPAQQSARAAWEAPHGEAEEWDLEIRDDRIAGPHGPVPVRWYRPRHLGASPVPCVLWLHGGGFAWGNLDMPEGQEVSRGLAGRLGALVVSVDYRLCPDPFAPDGANDPLRTDRWGTPAHAAPVRFPVPLDDVEAVLAHVRAHAGELGVDAARIAVGGASAGGNLAAAIALRTAGNGTPLWGSLPVYPVVHAVLPEGDDTERDALASVPPQLAFPADLVRMMNENYLGAPLADAPDEAFPGGAPPERLALLGPTYIETEELDDLRPSGRAYAEALAEAGVAVTCTVRRGVPHGHLNHRGLGAARATLDDMAAFLRGLDRPDGR